MEQVLKQRFQENENLRLISDELHFGLLLI